jgi:hypothetical protein
MEPLEMNEGTNYFQAGTKGLSVRPRCFGAAWSLPSGHHHHPLVARKHLCQFPVEFLPRIRKNAERPTIFPLYILLFFTEVHSFDNFGRCSDLTATSLMIMTLGTHTYRAYLESRVETWVYWHHICDYFSDVLAPLTGWPDLTRPLICVISTTRLSPPFCNQQWCSHLSSEIATTWLGYQQRSMSLVT